MWHDSYENGKQGEERQLWGDLEKAPLDFAGSPMVKHPPTDAGHMGLIPSLGRFHVLQGN